MAWRLRLAPEKTSIDFFRLQWITLGLSAAAVVLSLVLWATVGLNYGIDFKGGTTIRTDSAIAVDVGAYREALSGLGLGDVAVTEVFDPTFAADQHVAQVRIGAQEGEEAVTPNRRSLSRPDHQHRPSTGTSCPGRRPGAGEPDCAGPAG